MDGISRAGPLPALMWLLTLAPRTTPWLRFLLRAPALISDLTFSPRAGVRLWFLVIPPALTSPFTYNRREQEAKTLTRRINILCVP